MEKKERLLTIALHYTYEVGLECDDDTAKIIEGYPRDREKLPLEILEKIEEAGDHGKLVDDFAEVVEVEDCNLWEV